MAHFDKVRYNCSVSTPSWPDRLQPADPAHVADLLASFWATIATLSELIVRQEALLAAQATAELRACVLELMLALNGIAYPAGTRHLNSYLSPSQRAAIEKTLAAPSTGREAWVGQAVALIVIYHWYAPQLVARFGLTYPQAAEAAALAALEALPEWPLQIETE